MVDGKQGVLKDLESLLELGIITKERFNICKEAIKEGCFNDLFNGSMRISELTDHILMTA